MSIIITIAQLPSTSTAAETVTVEAGATIANILASKGIDASGKVLKLNGVEVSASSVATSDGMLTVTQGAKGNS